MPESPDIPENIAAKIRSVMPHALPSQEQPLPGQQADPDRNEPMPYLRPEGLLPVNTYVCPIDILSLDSNAQTATFRPFTVNQLVPSNFQDALSIANSVSYIYVHCETDGSQVNAVTLEVSSTPRPPPAVTMGSAPSAFDVLVWVIVRTSSGGGYTFSRFKIWGCGNIAASPVEFIRTDKSTPVPGQSSYDIWYAWSAVLG